MFHVLFCIPLLVIYMQAVADHLPRLGKRELICLLSFTCNYLVSVQRGFLFLFVLEMGCIILLWHSLGFPYNYYTISNIKPNFRPCTEVISYQHNNIYIYDMNGQRVRSKCILEQTRESALRGMYSPG